VLNTLEGVVPSKESKLSKLMAVFLLTTVVWNSDGTLDPQYGNALNAKALLEVEGELSEKLIDAWTKKKFEEIRNLSAIYVFFNAVCYIITQEHRSPSCQGKWGPISDRLLSCG
jgi:hypothetical protein